MIQLKNVTPIQEAAQQALRKIEQAKSVNHIVEPTEMIEDKFLEWLEERMEQLLKDTDPNSVTISNTLMEVHEKYRDIKS